MTPTRLEVLLAGQSVGDVERARTGWRFAYDERWRSSPAAHPLSLALPLHAVEHHGRPLEAYVWGLLPDNATILDRWARQPPNADFIGLVENEHACLTLARGLGLPCARSTVERFGDEVAIVIERRHRRACQALLPAARAWRPCPARTPVRCCQHAPVRRDASPRPAACHADGGRVPAPVDRAPTAGANGRGTRGRRVSLADFTPGKNGRSSVSEKSSYSPHSNSAQAE